MGDPVPSSAISDATTGGRSVIVVTGGSDGDVLTRQSDGTYAPETLSAASGDIVGPASATDNAVVRFDSTSGKLVQNSSLTIDDSGHVTTGGNFIVPSISSGSHSHKICVGAYGTISETGGGLAYITGNSVAAHTGINQVVKTSSDTGHFIRMRYDHGISLHTGISGNTGAVSADSVNQRLIIDGNGLTTFSKPVIVGVYTFATVPSASTHTGAIVRISDRAQKHAYSDGTNWRFFGDDAVIS